LAFGAGNYAMRVWIDPDKAAARELTAGDIIGAIREQNLAGLGRHHRRPAAPGQRDAVLDQCAGPPEHGRGIRRDRAQGEGDQGHHAAQGRGADRARLQQLHDQFAAEQRRTPPRS
jgi:hypothetical protein